jgi:predicted ATPase
MIQVNKITPQTVELFNPQGESMGFINEYEFNDIRIQIQKEKAEGYYLIFNNEACIIDKNGRVDYWPDGFFDLFDKQLDQLLGL